MERNIYDFLIHLVTVSGICVCIYFWFCGKITELKNKEEKK